MLNEIQALISACMVRLSTETTLPRAV